MYIILGWIGWIWLAVVMVLLAVGLWVQHLRRRKEALRALRGFEVTSKNEKQS
jgi:heme exporter protein D